jgi:hypothetical protein
MLNQLLKPRTLTLHTSGYWFAAFLVVTTIAFWPSYFGRLPARLDLLTHAHAALMTIWLGMLIAQPFLIRRERRPLHRLIGRASYVLVPLIAIVWVLLTHLRAAAMPDEAFATDGRFFYLPFVSSVLFVASWGLAIWRRHTPPLHARYMVGTALAAVDAVTARLLGFYGPPLAPMTYPLIGFGLTNGILLMLYFVDRGRHRQAFLHLLLLFAPLHLFWFTGAQTDWWLEIVRWFRALPLT